VFTSNSYALTAVVVSDKIYEKNKEFAIKAVFVFIRILKNRTCTLKFMSLLCFIEGIAVVL